ncbi:MAG: ClbS/DfsB family four-helix bundle protein [Paracoccaceae bacterium]|nr:ClbS/DfsB family four-helix bundle protein [Paracoccaceae bacterium]
MPAATSKQDLLAANEREWRKLCSLTETFDEDAAERPDQDGYTAKRLIGHRAAWIDLYFDWCAAVEKGKSPEMPAPGYKWNQLPTLNDQIFERQRSWSWSDACTALETAHERLTRDIAGSRDAVLYGKTLAPGLNWTRGRYAEAVGASHYRSAARALRKLKRENA